MNRNLLVNKRKKRYRWILSFFSTAILSYHSSIAIKSILPLWLMLSIHTIFFSCQYDSSLTTKSFLHNALTLTTLSEWSQLEQLYCENITTNSHISTHNIQHFLFSVFLMLTSNGSWHCQYFYWDTIDL